MTESRGPTITTIATPPAYFQVARTRTIHLVRTLVDVTWGRGRPSHTSVTYWCSNISGADKGGLSSNRPYDGVDCLRCIDAKTGRRNLARRRRAAPR